MDIDIMINRAFAYACGYGTTEDTEVISRIFDRADVDYRTPHMYSMHPDEFANALSTAFYAGAAMYQNKKIAI